MPDKLSIWTVYDHPSDFPSNFVARRFEGEAPTDDIIISPNLMALREVLAIKGLNCLTRNEADDPKIIETWF